MKILLTFLLFSITVLNANSQTDEGNTPAVPSDFKGEVIEKGGKIYIRLTWAKKSSDDSLTYGYHIYNNFPPETDLYQNGRINLLTVNQYDYEIKKQVASTYRFAITAVSSFPEKLESNKSNIVQINTPSTHLPPVKVESYSLERNIGTVSWKYPDIPDLSEFQIFLNGKKLILKADADKRTITFDIPESFKNPNFQILAKVKSGLESRKSSIYFLSKPKD